MIIYGNGKIFDPNLGHSVAEFLNGVIETKDERLIELCKLNGCEFEQDLPDHLEVKPSRGRPKKD